MKKEYDSASAAGTMVAGNGMDYLTRFLLSVFFYIILPEYEKAQWKFIQFWSGRGMYQVMKPENAGEQIYFQNIYLTSLSLRSCFKAELRSTHYTFEQMKKKRCGFR